MQRSTFAKPLWHDVLHLFFPKLCAGCEQPLPAEDDLLCFSCNQSIARNNIDPTKENEASLRLSGRFPFNAAFALCTFTEGSLIQQLLHQLKYHNKPHIGQYLGRSLAYALHDEGWWKEMDLLLPVPLHPRKEKMRGYNQSLHIVKGLYQQSQVPIGLDILLRKKFTESQTTKTRLQRMENVGDAFIVKQPEKLQGKHVLLVDDVLTTGATLESCANVLIAAGAKVSVATVAIASG